MLLPDIKDVDLLKEQDTELLGALILDMVNHCTDDDKLLLRRVYIPICPH